MALKILKIISAVLLLAVIAVLVILGVPKAASEDTAEASALTLVINE